MKIKKKPINILFFSLLLFLPLTLAQASPYQPSVPLLIETKIQATDSLSAQNSRQYSVKFNKESLRFYPYNSQQYPICTFTFAANGSMTWQKTQNAPVQTITSSIFLAPGFPLPIDILPVALQKKDREQYEITSHKGGRTFVTHYAVSITEIDFSTALSKGWLRIQPPLDPETLLLLFTVTDKQEHVVSMQLWPITGDWWLYEKTPFRQSWLLK